MDARRFGSVRQKRTRSSQEDRVKNAEKTCSSCHASESEIAERGHRELDGLGRPVAADTMTSTPCPEACTCMPQCFDAAAHEAFSDECVRDYHAAKAKKRN